MAMLAKNSSRQSPVPAPKLPDSPLARLPISKSSELKCAACMASSDSLTGPRRRPASSTAWMATSLSLPSLLMMRMKPCCPGLEVEMRSGKETFLPTAALPLRLARWPVGLSSKLMALIGKFDDRRRRHFPSPSPMRPSQRLPQKSSLPASNDCAVKVRDASAPSHRETLLLPISPRSS